MLRVILICGLLLACFAALAHTGLKSSVPGAQAVLEEPASEIVLEFSGAVRLTTVSLANSAGTHVALAELSVETQARFVIDVREQLPPGDYVITWRAVGADTHIVTGEIPFRVAAAAHAR